MITQIKLLSGRDCSVRLARVDAFLVEEGGYDGRPKFLYEILISGLWIVLADESEFLRLKQLVSETK